MKKKILFVDDEIQILKSLKRLFRNSDYDVFFASSGKTALELLEEEEPDLVISDIRMPEMDGFEFLRYVKENYPLTLRLALSGFTDNNKIYDALESNLAKLYMFKPWDNNVLIGTIERVFALEDTLKNKNLLDRINNLDEIPSIPSLYHELNLMVERDASIEEIAKKIEQDQSIASKILKVANSAFYGAKTGSISQAIMYIGLINVKNIVLTNSIFSKYGSMSEYKQALWEHVNLSNKIVTLIYQKCLNKRIPNVYASAGLLHDIGKVILLHFYEEVFETTLKRMKMTENVLTSSQIELELLGLNHQQLGGYLLSWWEIPLPIVEAALYHHDPLNENIINKELVQVVHIANFFAWKYLEVNYSNEYLNLGTLSALALDREFVESEIEKGLKK
ncbi:MAG: HDOD domain-containing protein [Clostridia bacterium]|nr:HDOD domain-containing protein [Clostridia bacterium]